MPGPCTSGASGRSACSPAQSPTARLTRERRSVHFTLTAASDALEGSRRDIQVARLRITPERAGSGQPGECPQARWNRAWEGPSSSATYLNGRGERT